MSTNRSYGDTVSSIVGPAVLATAVMNLHNWTYLQTANVLFGYYVSEKLEVPNQSSIVRAEPELLGHMFPPLRCLFACRRAYSSSGNSCLQLFMHV